MADITFSGTTGTVSTAFDTLWLDTGANVAVNAGAAGTGHAVNTGTGDEAIPAIRSDSSTLTITAGSFTGGDGVASNLYPECAIYSRNDAVTISGGTFSAGANPSGIGQTAAKILTPTSCAISGGTFSGGASTDQFGGGCGLLLSLSAVNATISGGTFTKGAGTGVGTGVDGYSLLFAVKGTCTLTLSGGTFTGVARGTIETGSKIRVNTTPGITPTRLDGTAWTSTIGIGYIDYSP